MLDVEKRNTSTLRRPRGTKKPWRVLALVVGAEIGNRYAFSFPLKVPVNWCAWRASNTCGAKLVFSTFGSKRRMAATCSKRSRRMQTAVTFQMDSQVSREIHLSLRFERSRKCLDRSARLADAFWWESCLTWRVPKFPTQAEFGTLERLQLDKSAPKLKFASATE